MLKIYNSLTRKKEEFQPINLPHVGMYTCGPTVYAYLTIGNFRTFTTADVLHRTLAYNSYKVNFVMNITDVGHLSGDNLGDADQGEDRLEKASRQEGKNAWEIAKFYTDAFLSDIKKLNIQLPDVLSWATDHIPEQIELVKKLEDKGLTYKTSDGIYFNTVKFEAQTGKKYGELSTLETIKEGTRVEKNLEKKNPRDFALWKFSYKDGRPFDFGQDDASLKRHMEWDSPWGLGFPGWHIECSAMSIKYLGETFDIHTGGEDLRQTHHPNEIAQAEGATGKTFVNYWVHTTFLLVDGKRMGKSMGNAYTMKDVEEKGYDPLALRYLYLTSHYRDQLNFTWDALDAVQTALKRLGSQMSDIRSRFTASGRSSGKEDNADILRAQFLNALNDDLNTPQALAVVWETIKSDITPQDKYGLMLYFDEVLGLGLGGLSKLPKVSRVPREVRKLARERDKTREAGDFVKADELRKKIQELGYKIEDASKGSKVSKL